tara:strand:+ start:1530 stop:2789 length:1260 start_codon:yes stop_codon:yes gene_type:complete
MEYLKSYKELNVSEDFTDQFRHNGYMMNLGVEPKVRKLFNSLLTKINDDGGDLLSTLEEEMDNGGSGQTDPMGFPAPWWIGTGENFTGFEHDGDEWCINYMADEYDEESDEYNTESNSMTVSNLGIGEVCGMMDFLMADHRVTDLLNYKALQTINSSPIKESFSDQFKTDKMLVNMFNTLLTKVNDNDPDLLEDIVNKMNDGGSGSIDSITDRPSVWWIGEGIYITGFQFRNGKWYINYSSPNNYDEERDEFYVVDGTECVEDHNVSSLRDMMDFIVNDYRVSDILNINALKKINEEFTDQFKSDEKIINIFNTLLTTIENKDHELFKELESNLKGLNDRDTFMVGDFDFFTGFTFPFGNDHWYIDYIVVNDDGFIDSNETESSKTVYIGVLKDIINEFMEDYRVTDLLNFNAMKKINK